MKTSNLRKSLFIYIFLLFLSVLLAFSLAFPSVFPAGAEEEGRALYVGGITAGFNLGGDGARVVGLSDVNTSEGLKSPARDASLLVGDCITEADGAEICGVNDLTIALKKSCGREMHIKIVRGGEVRSVKISPAKDISGNYKLGVLIRDGVSGVGTVTYIEKDTLRFGALGHAVTDENGKKLSLADGKVYACSIVGVTKGVRGRAGELKGLFINDKPIATADRIDSSGIFGAFSEDYDFSSLPVMYSAPASYAHIGKAFIYSTVSGTMPVKYSISIVKVDSSNKENKNFVIKVEDKDLLLQTGGIVQGMSGSPIIQDDRVVGAVTHVFLNDPARGYGIAIGNMLNNR